MRGDAARLHEGGELRLEESVARGPDERQHALHDILDAHLGVIVRLEAVDHDLVELRRAAGAEVMQDALIEALVVAKDADVVE